MTHWRKHQDKDPYFKKAKAEGYRARSAYKLLQIQKKFTIIRKGNIVIDLGAAPGSWSQVAVKLVGSKGHVLAVDIQAVDPIPGVTTLQGDMTDPEIQKRIIETVGGRADVIISDAAPFTTGVKLRDHVLSMELARAALAVAQELLQPGGKLVIKVFQGEDLPGVIYDVKMAFHPVKVYTPPATRKESWEQFIVAQGYKGKSRSQA